MSEQDPNCVYVTSNPKAADFVVAWLQDQGIAAEVQTHLKESDGVVLTPFSNSDMSNHLEVHITDVDKAEEVKELILANQDSIIQQAQAIDAAPPQDMVVVCESCGKSNVYPGELQGTVQDCQHCGHYLDVPGGEDEYDWSIVDETMAEDAEPADDETDDAWG